LLTTSLVAICTVEVRIHTRIC